MDLIPEATCPLWHIVTQPVVTITMGHLSQAAPFLRKALHHQQDKAWVPPDETSTHYSLWGPAVWLIIPTSTKPVDLTRLVVCCKLEKRQSGICYGSHITCMNI